MLTACCKCDNKSNHMYHTFHLKRCSFWIFKWGRWGKTLLMFGPPSVISLNVHYWTFPHLAVKFLTSVKIENDELFIKDPATLSLNKPNPIFSLSSLSTLLNVKLFVKDHTTTLNLQSYGNNWGYIFIFYYVEYLLRLHLPLLPAARYTTQFIFFSPYWKPKAYSLWEWLQC